MQDYACIGTAFKRLHRGRDMMSRCCSVLYKHAIYYYDKAFLLLR